MSALPVLDGSRSLRSEYVTYTAAFSCFQRAAGREMISPVSTERYVGVACSAASRCFERLLDSHLTQVCLVQVPLRCDTHDRIRALGNANG